MLRTMQDELQRLSELPQKVSVYITPEFIPVGYVVTVNHDFIRFQEELVEGMRESDQYITIPIENIMYVRERKEKKIK